MDTLEYFFLFSVFNENLILTYIARSVYTLRSGKKVITTILHLNNLYFKI